MKIFYIYSDNCLHCLEILNYIEKIIKDNDISCEILKHDYNTDVAVRIAVNNDIDDIPGIVISPGSKVFKGANIDKNKLKQEILKNE